MKKVSTLDSPFSDCPHEESLYSQCAIVRPLDEESLNFQFTILELRTRRQSPFSIVHHQAFLMKKVSILNSTLSDFPHEDSLHSKLAVLKPPMRRKNPFSIRYSQADYMKTAPILNSRFSHCLRAGSLCSQLAILALPA